MVGVSGICNLESRIALLKERAGPNSTKNTKISKCTSVHRQPHIPQ